MFVTSGGQTQPFTLIVTTVHGSDINFSYQPLPLGDPAVSKTMG